MQLDYVRSRNWFDPGRRNERKGLYFPDGEDPDSFAKKTSHDD
jgi:hypothetical protein